MKLESFLKSNDFRSGSSRPEIYNINISKHRRKVTDLFNTEKVKFVSDDYLEQLRELFSVQHPSLVNDPKYSEKFVEYIDLLKKSRSLEYHGKWIFFPWLATIVHLLDDKDFQLVRMARNRNLITIDEQRVYYRSVVGIAGLSVGNSVALALALQGAGSRFRLADFDNLALSNLNRIRTGVQNLGLPKVEITARQIYQINPYAKIDIFSKGLSRANVKKFFEGPPKLDIIIDELDNLAVKYLIRQQAKKSRTPIVMGADNGDNAVIDVERYDLNPRIKFFHGRMGRVSYENLASLNKFGIGKMITKHIGLENVTPKMQESLAEMGKTIVSWPQLGGAALLNGSGVAYIVRRILNKQPTVRNRAIISLDEKIIPDYNSAKRKKRRAVARNKFGKILGL